MEKKSRFSDAFAGSLSIAARCSHRSTSRDSNESCMMVGGLGGWNAMELVRIGMDRAVGIERTKEKSMSLNLCIKQHVLRNMHPYTHHLTGLHLAVNGTLISTFILQIYPLPALVTPLSKKRRERRKGGKAVDRLKRIDCGVRLTAKLGVIVENSDGDLKTQRRSLASPAHLLSAQPVWRVTEVTV
ncbi:hypothetical protein SCHPADRAFT_119145 [Schizopora paradoxa]|uniref:Uncharacterized protein n=1 Tax=Schizopora paradoxa TaxID=27342 RepID=A0A0H2S9W2_9AGAM|nr:hypothetical protein SCHPADRAFT_119145 [Schizopora paradoxa]